MIVPGLGMKYNNKYEIYNEIYAFQLKEALGEIYVSRLVSFLLLLLILSDCYKLAIYNAGIGILLLNIAWLVCMYVMRVVEKKALKAQAAAFVDML